MQTENLSRRFTNKIVVFWQDTIAFCADFYGARFDKSRSVLFFELHSFVVVFEMQFFTLSDPIFASDAVFE